MSREFINTVKTLFTDDQLKHIEKTSSDMGMNLSEFLRCSAMYACRLAQENIIDAGDLKPFNREYGLHKEVALARKDSINDKLSVLKLPRGAFNGTINEGICWSGIIILRIVLFIVKHTVRSAFRVSRWAYIRTRSLIGEGISTASRITQAR